MTGDKTDYIRYRMQRAFETLREAELLLDSGLVSGAVNRIYYACFYAVSALLVSEGYSSAKHSGVMSLFDQHWIKPGSVPKEAGTFYHFIFKHRQRSDYGDLVLYERQEVEKWLAEAKLFVERIIQWLKDAGIDV